MAQSKPYYVTTPIYYVNARPHIGTAYTTIAADAVARFQRLLGREVFFATGTDEHAEKVERAAAERGLSVKEHTDEMADAYREAWARLGITYDDFIRTSEPRHHRATEEVFRRLRARGDIYKGEYEGWYCVSCATYWLESDLNDGRCPNPECGRPVERRRQPAYFFRASAYGERVAEYIESHPGFIRPEFRANEVLSFIRQGMRDVCISRPNSGWGVPVPDDPEHVVYVWFDALINYLTVVGFPDDMERFERYWPADVHFIGKDILTRFHGSLWPAMLMALELPLPRAIVAHGFWLMGKSKISKSAGGLVTPDELAAHLCQQTGMAEPVALDVVRYFLLRETPFGQDCNFSEEALRGRLNADLANDLGNLVNRSLPLIERHFQGQVPQGTLDGELAQAAERAASAARERYEQFDFRGALEATWELLGSANKFIDYTAPWQLAKEGRREELADALFSVAEVCRIACLLVYPVMPHAAGELRRQLGLPPRVKGTWDELCAPGAEGLAGASVRRGRPVFPRIERPVAVKEEEPMEQAQQPLISIDEFSKIDLRACTVLAVDKVPGADKLYALTVDLGTEQRTVVAGVAEEFSPEELLGKTLVLVANLKPAKIRGVTSQGMILAVGEDKPLGLVVVDRPVPPGSKVR